MIIQSQSDTMIREMVRIVTQICKSEEFIALKEELEELYHEAGQPNFDDIAFADALYAILIQSEDTALQVKELL